MGPFFLRSIVCLFAILSLAGCAHDKGASGLAEATDTTSTGTQSELIPVAAQAERSHSYEEAAKIYASLLAQEPNNRNYRLNLARNLRYSGQTQTAIDLLTAPETPQDDPMMMLELGKSYLAADQLNLARPLLEKTKRSAPLNWEMPMTLGVVLDYMNENAAAQEEYKAALQLSPDNPTILNNLALSLAQEGKLDEAISTMQRATDQQSAQAQSRQNLAFLLALKGKPEEAERLVRKDLPPNMAENNVNYYRSLVVAPAN